MSRVRIYELAKEAGMASKVLADKLIDLGYDIKGYGSTVDNAVADEIRKKVLQNSGTELVEKRIAVKKGPTVIRRRSTIVRRRPVAEPDDTEEEILEKPVIEEDMNDGQEAEEQQLPPESVEVPEKEQEPVEEEAVQTEKETSKSLSAPTVDELIKAAEVKEKLEQERLAQEAVEKQKEEERQAQLEKEEIAKKRKGLAKVVGTVVLPEVKTSSPPARPRKKPRPALKKPGAQVQDPKKTPVDQENQRKKGGKRVVQMENDDTRRGKGAKQVKKGKKKVQFTHFDNRYRHRPGKKKKGRKQGDAIVRDIQETKAIKKRIKVFETISVADLAHRMGVKANEVIAKLMGLGLMVTMNQALDVDTAILVASDFGFEVEQAITEEIGVKKLDEDEGGGKLIPRPPVMTVMGHVDHGKTSILDAIRNTDVADGEAGGITQHIGAYHVRSKAGDVTFVDTPGHAAFTEMRSRGAQITDLIILVVAADDGVMEQTREAIHHAQAAEVPIIVAVNKIDKANSEPDRVKRELAELDLAPEEWGGQTIYCETSAKKGEGIDELLESVQLMAEMLELKADPARKARGRVVEAQLHKGRGPVATILVQEGTLMVGDHFIVGRYSGKVRSMLDDKSNMVMEAGPAMPVEVQGLSGVPSAGDEFIVVTDEKMAKNLSQARTLKARETELAADSKVSLDKLFERMAEDSMKELRIVLRADVQGTLEAFGKAAEKLSTSAIKVKILHEGTGTITESDVLLASASDAIIIGFNVRPSGKVKELGDKENVDLRSYDVIYHALDDIRDAMVGMLEPVFEEEVIGNAEVRETFHVPKVGTIAGCSVTEGKVTRNADVRVIRDGVVVYTGKVGSLRRFKDDAKEVLVGYECGIGVENFNDIKIGDNLETFIMNEVAATLDDE